MRLFSFKTGVIVIMTVIGLISAPAYSLKSAPQAPNFSVENLLSDNKIELEQYKGKLVYLDFWASWCPPCVKSFPFMEELKAKYSEQGLVVIAISLDGNSEDAKAFLQRANASFLVGHSSESDSVATDYNVQAMPSSYIIGRDGTVVSSHRGFTDSDKDKINKIITEIL